MEFVDIAHAHLAPQIGFEQLVQAHGRRRFGLRHQAAAGVDVVATEIADRIAGAVAVLLVQHAPGLQTLQQAFLVFPADALVQRALIGSLG